MADLLYDSSEAMFIVGSVFDDTYRTVRFDEAVLPPDNVAISFFVLLLYVTCMRVVNSVLVLVFRVVLQIQTTYPLKIRFNGSVARI